MEDVHCGLCEIDWLVLLNAGSDLLCYQITAQMAYIICDSWYEHSQSNIMQHTANLLYLE